MRQISKWILLVALTVFVAACAPVTQTPVSVNPGEESYPSLETTGPTDLSSAIQGYPDALSSDVEKGVIPQAPADAPVPDEGLGSISGALYSFTSQVAVVGTQVYLTHGIGEGGLEPPGVLVGPQPEKGDVVGTTESTGILTINNIPPGTYFLIVSSPYTWNPALVSDTDFTPRKIEVKAGEGTPLGVLYVSWP